MVMDKEGNSSPERKETDLYQEAFEKLKILTLFNQEVEDSVQPDAVETPRRTSGFEITDQDWLEEQQLSWLGVIHRRFGGTQEEEPQPAGEVITLAAVASGQERVTTYFGLVKQAGDVTPRVSREIPADVSVGDMEMLRQQNEPARLHEIIEAVAAEDALGLGSPSIEDDELLRVAVAQAEDEARIRRRLFPAISLGEVDDAALDAAEGREASRRRRAARSLVDLLIQIKIGEVDLLDEAAEDQRSAFEKELSEEEIGEADAAAEQAIDADPDLADRFNQAMPNEGQNERSLEPEVWPGEDPDGYRRP